jgi:hypothetical protein
MTAYNQNVSSLFGLISIKAPTNLKKITSIALGLKSLRVKSFLHRAQKPLLGLKSARKKTFGIAYASLIGLVSAIAIPHLNKVFKVCLGLVGLKIHSISVKRLLLSLLGIKYQSDAPSTTYSEGGIPAGAKLYYSIGGSPEIWRKETARTKIKLTDAIAGRSRIVSITLANPKNSKDSLYTIFKRIKVVDHITNQIFFLGRVNVSNSGWDPELGLVLNISAQDYMYELTTRYCTTNYSTAIPKSTMVSQIVSSNSTAGSLSLDIEPGLPLEKITRNFATSNKKCTEAIEEIAVDDGIYCPGEGSIGTPGFTLSIINYPVAATQWIFNMGTMTFKPAIYPFLPASSVAIGDTFAFNASVPDGARITITIMDVLNNTLQQVIDLPVANYKSYVYDYSKEYYSGIYTIGCDYRVRDSQVFEYFPRGSRPIGGTANGLTISLMDTSGDQLKRMLSDYNFSSSPKDIITHVICRGQDANGTKLEASATNAVLESTYGIRTEYIDSVYGTTTQAFLNTRANSLLTVFGKTIKRGTCKIMGYPIYKIGSTYYIVRAGDIIHIHNVLQSIDQDYLVVSLEYEEPTFITKFELLDLSNYGRELPPSLGGSLSASDIGDLKQPSPARHSICFYIPDALSVASNASAEIPIPFAFTCDDVYINVKTAPVGSAISVDVLLDGVSIFSGSLPTIYDGMTSGSFPPTTTYFNQNQILSVDVISIGSTTEGADLTVEVRGQEYIYQGEGTEPEAELPTPNPFYYFSVFDGLFYETEVELEAHLTSIWASIPDTSLVYAVFDQKVISGVSHGSLWYNFFTAVPITLAYKYAWVPDPKLYVYFDTGFQYTMSMTKGTATTIQSQCYIGSTTIQPGRYTDGQPINLGVYYLKYINPTWNPELDTGDPAVYLTSNIEFICNE